MGPLGTIAMILLMFIKEVPLATTIDRDEALPESLEIDGASSMALATGGVATIER
jgi:hypothetical protein